MHLVNSIGCIMVKRKELWRTIKLLLLFLVLSEGLLLVGVIAFVFHDMSMGMTKEAIEEHFMRSNFTKCLMIMGYALAIAVFIHKRYVKVSLGRLARMNRNTLWKAVGMAAVISLGWMFTEVSFMALIDVESLFPEDSERLDRIYGAMGEGVLGFLAGAIMGPIAEEITFRGVLMRGLLRMRWHPWVAIVVSALVFALCHGTELQMFGTTIFGIITGWLYWRTKSLLPGMIVHIVNNSFAFGASNLLSDDDDSNLSAKVCIITLAISIPLLMYGINWYKKH